MSKIKLATAFINTVQRVVKHFSVAEKDNQTGIKHWRDEVDFEVEGTPSGTTNNNVVDKKGNPLKVLEFGLKDLKRRDGDAEDDVSVFDFIEAIYKLSAKRLKRGDIKFILDANNKSGILKAIKEGYITKNNNLISEETLVRKEIKVIPDLDLDLDEKEVNGMKDIKEKIKSKAKESAKKDSDLIEKTLEE